MRIEWESRIARTNQKISPYGISMQISFRSHSFAYLSGASGEPSSSARSPVALWPMLYPRAGNQHIRFSFHTQLVGSISGYRTCFSDLSVSRSLFLMAVRLVGTASSSSYGLWKVFLKFFEGPLGMLTKLTLEVKEQRVYGGFVDAKFNGRSCDPATCFQTAAVTKTLFLFSSPSLLHNGEKEDEDEGHPSLVLVL
ncbi:hypothetical protein BC938DRAFT_471018 [Jimgerdemannia flammicorona]|uniref:Uncharacterized protein n=1 Tax=Jimgerdemannia flammicorona TaxID=994334 RepID=A0A433QUW2_9FUNG|nr:hypothetical protein BC938DRAFT_471018 [Jimgerdemannia flammicorona]